LGRKNDMATSAALTVVLRAKTGAFDKRLKRSSKRVANFSKVAKKAALAIGGFFAGRALFRFAQNSALAFAEFEEGIAKINTLLDKSTEKFLPEFAKEITALSIATGETTQALSKGLFDIISASIDASQALGVLEVAARAAVGGFTDAAVAVDGLTSLLNAFQLDAKEAGRVSDIMFQTIKRGKLEFVDLAANVGKVAPLARAAGVSMETMSAAISTLTRQGLSAEEATTRFNAVMKTLPREAGNLLKLVQRFRGRSLASILGEVPNVRAAAGIAALAGDIEGLTKDIDLMNNSLGEADKAFDKAFNTQANRLRRLGRRWDALKVSVGESIFETADTFLDPKAWAGVAGFLTKGMGIAPKLAEKLIRFAASEEKITKSLSKQTSEIADNERQRLQILKETARLREIEIKRLIKMEKIFKSTTKSLREQIIELRFGANELKLFQLEQKGLSQVQLQAIAGLQEQVRQIKALQKAEKERLKGLKDIKKKEKERLADLAAEGKKVFEEMQTPLERFESEIGRLSELLQLGAIDWETYGRAIRGAIEFRESSLKAGRGGGPGTFGVTSSAVGAIGVTSSQNSMKRLNEERNRLLVNTDRNIGKLVNREGLR